VPSKATISKLTDVFAALKTGHLPTQEQLNKALQTLSNSDVLNSSAKGRTSRFSKEGALVVEDLRAVLESLQKVGSNKNKEDRFQRFIYATTQADVDLHASTEGIDAPNRKEVEEDRQKAMDSIRTLGQLFISSPEFRKIISDSTFLVRDLFADAAERVANAASDAAEKARPSEEERQKGVNADPQSLKRKAKQVQRDYRTGRLNLTVEEQKVRAREWAEDQEPQDKAVQAKDEVIERLKNLVVSVQENDSYHSSIDTLINLLKKYGTKAQEAAHQAAENTDIQTDENAQEAMTLLRGIVEDFAGGKSLDDVFRTFDKVVEDVKNDERLSTYFDDLQKFGNRLLHDEGYVLSQKASRKAEEFVDRAQELIQSNDQIKADVKALTQELKGYQKAFEAEKDTKELFQNLQNLSEDVADMSAAGLNIFSAQAKGFYRDFWNVILPRLISSVKEIPLPRIEYISADFDLAIDDFTLKSASFIPDKIEFINRNDILLEQGYAAFASNFDTTARLRVTGLRFSAKNIAYYICSKKGYGYEDSGLLDIDLVNRGLSFDVELENASGDDRETFFKVKKVNVDLSSLNYSVSQSDHWILNSLLKPFARPFINMAIDKALEAQIKSSLEEADKQFYGLQQRTLAATRAQPSPANYLRAIFNIGFHPSQAFSPSPSAKTTTTGVIVTGAHGEYKMAIGAEEQLLEGRAGPSASYHKRKSAIEQAKAKAKASGLNSRTAPGQAERAIGNAKDQIGALSTEAKKKERLERQNNDWKSDAFNL